MRNVLIFFAMLMLAVLGWWWLGPRDLATLQHHVAGMRNWTDGHPVIAPLAYTMIYAGAAALNLPVALALSLGAGALFGFWTGLAAALAGASLGATGSMLIGRHLLRDWAMRVVGRRQPPDGDWMTLLGLRLLPVAPFTLINLGMALTRIPAMQFLAVSVAGMAPATAITVNAGTQLAQLDSLSDIASPVMIASLAALGLLPLLVRLLGWWRHRDAGR